MASPTGNDRSALVALSLAIALMVWIVVVVTCSQLRMAPTFDEQNHVTRGIAILRTGDYRLCFHHPPLANIMEGLPVAWRDNGFSTRMPAWRPYTKDSMNIWAASNLTIWSHPRQGVKLIHLARIPVLVFTLVLALLIFLWSRELFGPWGGVFSLALFALDPTVLAHSGLATTDMAAACTIVLAMYWLRRYLLVPSKGRFVVAGLGIGLALAAKFSALILLPILALLLLIFALRSSRLAGSLSDYWAQFPMGRRVLRAVGVGVVLLAVAGVTVWGVYGGKVEALGSKPGIALAANASLKDHIPVPAMQYLRGIKAVTQEADEHRSFLLGETDTTGKGWWYYFPVAIATKTPLPELLFILGALVLLVIPRTRNMIALPKRELVFLLLPVAIYLMAALGLLGISLNLGIRHILPLYPFLFILAGSWLRLRVSSRAYYPAVLLLLLLQGGSILMAYPNFIAYFNELSEAKEDGYNILVDSNYDWGQDLAQLATLQRQEHLTPMYLSYFGTTPPEAFGINYRPLPGFGLMRGVAKPDLRNFHGYVAISVTNLMGGKAYTGVDYHAFQDLLPYDRAGKTIMIYYLP